jgi:CheY-like chemotaxis protein
VTRKNRKYSLTSLGKIVYELQITTQNALNNYWKLRAIDSLDGVSALGQEQLIENLIADEKLRELLTKKCSDIVTSDLVENSSGVLQQTEESNHGNLMLVEDEHDILFAFKAILKSEGYNVDTFTDSFEALKHFIKLNRPYYDLVILDIRMRGMNGIQLYQKLKRIDDDLRVIFVTALDAARELISIIPNLNSQYIVRKPIAARDFIKVVNKAVK